MIFTLVAKFSPGRRLYVMKLSIKHLTALFARNRKLLGVSLATCGLGLYGWLLYWLMPVAIPSRLAADHLRWTFSEVDADRVAVVPNSLNALWLLILEVARVAGVSDANSELVAWAAALSATILVTSVALVVVCATRKFQKFHLSLAFTVLLLALTPAVLWTGVVPNGFVLGFFFVALLAFAQTSGRARYGFSVLEGFAAGLTPAAWVLSLALAASKEDHLFANRFAKSRRMLRVGFFVFGMSIHPLLKIVFEEAGAEAARNSISWFPVYDSLRAVRFEDLLGGPMVMLGPVGETATGLIASIAFSVAILTIWLGFKPVRVALLALGFLLPLSAGQLGAWRLAHPGWNTALEDVALNVDRSLTEPTVVLVDRLTEEAVFRFASSLQVAARRPGATASTKAARFSYMQVVNSRKIFEASEITRIQTRIPKYSLSEAGAASQLPEDEIRKRYKDATDMFLKAYVFPNVRSGIPFFVGAEFISLLENRESDLDIYHRYFMNGVRVSVSAADKDLRLVRENLQSGFIRARLGYEEGQLQNSAEVQAYERYAIYHLARASEYNRVRTPKDWQARSNAELYAALKKVPWLDEPYRIVCEEPEKRPKSELELKGNAQQTAVEPLDVCKEIFTAKGVFGYGR